MKNQNHLIDSNSISFVTMRGFLGEVTIVASIKGKELARSKGRFCERTIQSQKSFMRKLICEAKD